MPKMKFLNARSMKIHMGHYMVFDVLSTTGKTTWKAKSGKFSYVVDRPEKGEQDHTLQCPFCGVDLKFTVESQEKMLTTRESNIKFGIRSAIAFLVFGGAAAALALSQKAGLSLEGLPLVVLIVCIFGAMISFSLALIGLGEYPNDRRGLVSTGELKNQFIAGPYNQHYIETVDPE